MLRVRKPLAMATPSTVTSRPVAHASYFQLPAHAWGTLGRPARWPKAMTAVHQRRPRACSPRLTGPCPQQERSCACAASQSDLGKRTDLSRASWPRFLAVLALLGGTMGPALDGCGELAECTCVPLEIHIARACAPMLDACSRLSLEAQRIQGIRG